MWGTAGVCTWTTPLYYYTNDLEKSIKCKCIIFADDTTIYTCGKDIRLLYGRMNDDLRQLSNWFKVNKLSLNIGKTNYILFSCKNNKTIDEENHLEIDNVNQYTKSKHHQNVGDTYRQQVTMARTYKSRKKENIKWTICFKYIQICAATNPNMCCNKPIWKHFITALFIHT